MGTTTIEPPSATPQVEEQPRLTLSAARLRRNWLSMVRSPAHADQYHTDDLQDALLVFSSGREHAILKVVLERRRQGKPTLRKHGIGVQPDITTDEVLAKETTWQK